MSTKVVTICGGMKFEKEININGYIGNATQNEIEYAKANGKEVMYHEKN